VTLPDTIPQNEQLRIAFDRVRELEGNVIALEDESESLRHIIERIYPEWRKAHRRLVRERKRHRSELAAAVARIVAGGCE
jgi:hypothetical protein